MKRNHQPEYPEDEYTKTMRELCEAWEQFVLALCDTLYVTKLTEQIARRFK